jgi:hypothetical protein
MKIKLQLNRKIKNLELKRNNLKSENRVKNLKPEI